MAPTTDPSFFLINAKLTPSSNVVRNLICTLSDDTSSPKGHSIVIHNIPPLISEKQLSFALKNIASVQTVTFASNVKKLFGRVPHIGYNKATVTFVDEDGVKSVQNATSDNPIVLSVPLTAARLQSLAELKAEQVGNYESNCEKWRREADEIVKLYDAEVKLKEKVTKLYSGEVDDEGWRVVRRNRADGQNREKVIRHRMQEKQEKKKRLEANVAEIYQYRMRNEKLGKLRVLRDRFEEDKKKIAQMRAGRKFKPM